MTPIVTDGPTVIAAQAETPQGSTAFAAWLNNAMQHHGAQTAAHSVEVDVDIDLEGDAAVAHEDELHATIEQLNGMMSGNQVSATPVALLHQHPLRQKTTSQRRQPPNSTVTEQLLTSCSNSTAKWSTAGWLSRYLRADYNVTSRHSNDREAAPAAAPQNIEVAASPEALQPIGVAPVSTPTSDAAQGNETIVQAAPELVDNNDVKPIIRLDAATPTTATSQITPAAAQNSFSTVVDGLAQLVTSHAQKASQTGTSSRLSITLRPDDLGTVQLEIRAGANGLEIATATTHESGRAAIESVIPEIRTMAQQSGLRISEIQIGTNSSSDNLADLHQHGDRRDNHQQPERHRRTPEAANMTRTVNLTDSHIGQVNVEV